MFSSISINPFYFLRMPQRLPQIQSKPTEQLPLYALPFHLKLSYKPDLSIEVTPPFSRPQFGSRAVASQRS